MNVTRTTSGMWKRTAIVQRLALLTITAVAVLLFAVPSAVEAGWIPLVEHAFDGANVTLNGVTADYLSPAVLAVNGGSATWAASSLFRADGSVTGSGSHAAHIKLGSYINDAKGEENGKFKLTATMYAPTNANWVTLGFSELSSPITTGHIANASVKGFATMRHGVGGTANTHTTGTGTSDSVTHSLSTPPTVTVMLDYTPAGGYNGTNNFGTVTFSNLDSVLWTWSLTQNYNVGAILLSKHTTAAGTPIYQDLSLSQIPEPGTALLLLSALACGLLVRRRRGKE